MVEIKDYKIKQLVKRLNRANTLLKSVKYDQLSHKEKETYNEAICMLLEVSGELKKMM